MKAKIEDALKNIAVGDTVKRNLHGAGHVTEAEDAQVEHVDKETGIFWTNESDGGFVSDSIYAHSMATGATINNMVPGFFLKVTEVVKD